MKHPLSSLQEPGAADIARALFVAVFMARENLSLAERHAESDGNERRHIPRSESALLYVEGAIGNLKTAKSYLEAGGPLDHGSYDPATKLASERAIRASEAAASHIQHYESYAQMLKLSISDEHKRYKLRQIWRRSAESARKEAHILLVAVMERFPDSYEKDEFFDGQEEEKEEAEEVQGS